MQKTKKLLALAKTILDLMLPPPAVDSISKEQFIAHVEDSQYKNPCVIEDWAFAAYRYKNRVVREVVRALKYKNSVHAAYLLANGLYQMFLEHISDILLFDSQQEILLIPIPLSSKRFRQRGYNQSLLLAEHIIKIFEVSEFVLAPHVLEKHRHTTPQTKTASRSERLKNIRGCFRVTDKKILKGKTVILIDDVITTGTTVSEARKTLLNAGAKKVYALAVAH